MIQSTSDLRIEMESRPYVPVLVNDRGPFCFLLDTGALSASVSSDVARTLALPDEQGWVTTRTLAIGDSRWHGLGMGAGDNTALSRALGRQVDGILGSRFFASVRAAVTLDYPRQTLSLEEIPEGAGPLTAGVPLRLANAYPLVPVTLNGSRPYHFLVDTGASPCIVAPGVAQALGIPVGRASAAHGAADSIASYESVVAALTVGDVTVRDLTVTVMDCSGVNENAGCPVAGYLGHSFLSRFVVTLDYPRERLILRQP